MPVRLVGRAARSWLAPAGVWLLASACGPGVATPIPEPPANTAFDLGGLDPGIETTKQPLDPDTYDLTSQPGAVPGGATVRITNLDRTTRTVAATATADGVFSAVIVATDGEELRFEWVKGDRHSLPADARFVHPAPTGRGYDFVPVTRLDCLKLIPGLALDFAEGDTQTLALENDCSQAVQLDSPRKRLDSADFSLPTLPAAIGPKETVELRVDLNASTAGPREDVLFFDATLGDETVRYAITLRAE
jgi:hypothetical protein